MSRDGLLEGDGGNDGDSGPAIPFPFEPYEVQKQLMCKIYNTLERGGIGIFESPTGTVSGSDFHTVVIKSPFLNKSYGCGAGPNSVCTRSFVPSAYHTINSMYRVELRATRFVEFSPFVWAASSVCIF